MAKIGVDAAFPREFQFEARTATFALNLSPDYYSGNFMVDILGENVFIPRRVLRSSINPNLSGLSPQQRKIAQCILTRSTDGFERQAALKEVLPINEPWSIPFFIALAGEYIIEIIDDIYTNINRINFEIVENFIGKNPNFHKITRDRVMSYWNCYYRHQFQRTDYVGFRLLRELDAVAKPQKAA